MALGLQRDGLARIAALALDVLFPPRCLACGTETESIGTLCATCWPKIGFIAAPLCAACGVPFPFEAGLGSLCGACVQHAPDFDRARAVFIYGEASRNLVLGFKHADHTHTAPAFGRWLARAGAELLTDADLLIPVPLHRRRLFMRRYNQAALLAYAVAKVTGGTVAPDALLRVKRTTPHVDMGRSARLRNVAGAFAVHRRWTDRLGGARVVLIDDVFTTGATVSACARSLRRAGAARIDVLTLARVMASGA